MKGRVVVESDGTTVWVNTLDGMIGRFGRAGIDIHRPLKEQSEKGECLYCTHAMTTSRDWPIFVQKMKELFDIDVPESHKPARFNGMTSCKD